MRAFLIFLIVNIFFSLVPVAEATSVTLRNGDAGYTGCTDNHIESNNPTTNRGTDTDNVFSNYNASHILIRFDVSSIPSGSTINSATISVFSDAAYNSGSGSLTARLYELRRTWGETTSTWNKYDGTNNWTIAGANDTTTDRQSTEAGTWDFSSWQFLDDVYVDGTLTASIVSGWVNNSATNYGLVAILDGVSTGEGQIDFSDHATSSKRPKLVIDYTAPATGSGSLTIANGGSSTLTIANGGSSTLTITPVSP